MESQAWTDDTIRPALEAAQLQEAIHQSKQPHFPKTSPTAKHSATPSAAKTDVPPQKHTPGQKQRPPPEHKTRKHTKATKATQHTPVKATPPNRPTLTNTTLKQTAKHTPAEPHTPAPKRRRTKTTPSGQHNEQAAADIYTDNTEQFAEEAIFDQFAAEDSPIIPSPELGSPAEPVEPTRKKRREH